MANGVWICFWSAILASLCLVVVSFHFVCVEAFGDGPSFASPVVGRANSVGTIWVPQRHRCVRST